MHKRLNRLYLVRHGQVQGQESQRIFGSTDVEITDLGKTQMKHLAEKLRFAEIDVIYSSMLKRTISGAQIIGQWHDGPVFHLPEFAEMDFGAWEGMAFSEIAQQFQDELAQRQSDILHYRAPGARDTIQSLAERVLGCLKEIRRKHDGQNILLVGHAGVNRVILCDALGLDLNRVYHLHQDYGCLNIIDYFPDSTLVRLVNG
ncbi:MAG: histidine phosphatase family protein [Desulfobacteraceae bacterium]|nr:MAG: histidine phosphatase family protein [Desulfobacteraceae bacterium]